MNRDNPTWEVTREACEITKLYSRTQNFCPTGILGQLDSLPGILSLFHSSAKIHSAFGWKRTFLFYFLWLWICSYCSWVYLWTTEAFTRDDLLVTLGRAVPVLSLLTIFPLQEGSLKELSLLQLASGTQHCRCPPGSVKSLWDDGGKEVLPISSCISMHL